jgi:hypothetical protein
MAALFRMDTLRKATGQQQASCRDAGRSQTADVGLVRQRRRVEQIKNDPRYLDSLHFTPCMLARLSAQQGPACRARRGKRQYYRFEIGRLTYLDIIRR